MSSFSAPRDPSRRGFTGGNARTRALVPTVVILVALIAFFAIFTKFWTDRLWFQAIDYSKVFSTTLVTRIGMFAVFGVVLGAIVFGNLALAYRLRPRYRAVSAEQQTLDRYRAVVDPHRKLIGGLIAALLALIAGSSASGRWETFLQWRNATPFGTKDPQFHLDVSFYVFGYPWYRFLIGFGFTVIVLSLLAALIAHYLYGGIRLQSQGQKASAAAQAHMSVLLGLFVLLKAVAYWFDRFGLVVGSHQMSNQAFTGITYTDAHAVVPAKTILTIIAAICAVLFFANVVRRTWMLPGLGLGLLVLSAVLLGWAWPAIVQQVTVRPNEPVREAAYIQRNIDATRAAYGVADAEVKEYSAKTSTTAGQLADDAQTLPGVRLIDPAIVGETFEQLQQVRGFYTFNKPLDVDRYTVDGQSRDAVVAVRELNLEGVPDDQRNWNNDHTVYTHGYGMVAANGNRRTGEGTPDWLQGGIPSTGDLGKYEPRVYFGEESPPYSIVGAPKGSEPVELDIPGGGGGAKTTNTYQGKGGVQIGSFGNRLLYAAKFQDFNILLNQSRINGDSKILYDRSPRDRVQKVAPWLTLDADPYPAIVDGRIKWIVDGYTMSPNYPLSQRVALDDATSTSLDQQPAIVGQPSERINYVRNSVKATVDAYDGSVSLYAWDEKDPVLRTWMKAFPNTVQPRSKIPDALLDHVRYPEDLMKIQREILAQYHVTKAGAFYQGTERWRVPSDPTRETSTKQPAYYLSVRMPGEDTPTFSLTSTYIYFNRENLAAFVAVDADARSPDYGKIRVLQLDDKTQIDGPSQIANRLESDTRVADALLPLTRGESRAVKGNLLTLPVGGGLLYVQPVYVQRGSGDASYPLLRLVLASFGGQTGVGETLQDALNMVFRGNAGANTGEHTDGEQPPPAKPGEPAPPPTETVATALAEANKAFEDAQAALRKGDLKGYADAVAKAQAAVNRAAQAQGRAQPNPPAGGDNAPTPTPTPTPSRSPSTAARSG
ncbi:UPF0182 family protein [Actinopolymorpha pittospori]|uniref:UPF0182 protein HEB94_008552 n=1 Tax=Actinopolymorpha pittospori TaxID=648752 RepID=A0A927RE26_9ACTN|nr:uncharacterized membrane protein (UPF0182 family) [Actinopolymorpha pittospori]